MNGKHETYLRTQFRSPESQPLPTTGTDKPKSYRQLLLLPLLFWALTTLQLSGLQAQEMEINTPILPLEFWEHYSSEEEALTKAENGSQAEKRKAAITLFLLSRDIKNKSESLKMVTRAGKIINRIYRRNRNDLGLGLIAGEINMGVADKSSKLKDKINYTNRGLANYDFVLPNIPGNLEAKQIYLRTTVYIPTYFKNLTKEQLQHVKSFFDGYEAALTKLESEEERQRLEELKTHVAIIAAKISSRKAGRSEVEKYLAQVDTGFFDTMKTQSNGDLVKMYNKLKK
ncbi:hypothetical protein P0082_00270 [Candidatus Haliotispira prima]|uniref:Uncharacterized protein n=1 Tax=Candidatus Haliotispira prima TaxID=3034016 RepID=A0ABY8MIC6_9SPIO|nr:hypothetical protein P0082_00270 [Candidatus Haliotispira prima]